MSDLLEQQKSETVVLGFLRIHLDFFGLNICDFAVVVPVCQASRIAVSFDVVADDCLQYNCFLRSSVFVPSQRRNNSIRCTPRQAQDRGPPVYQRLSRRIPLPHPGHCAVAGIRQATRRSAQDIAHSTRKGGIAGSRGRTTGILGPYQD